MNNKKHTRIKKPVGLCDFRNCRKDPAEGAKYCQKHLLALESVQTPSSDKSRGILGRFFGGGTK